ncbi:dihydroorotase [Parasphingorhabdus marina DSM 22363]|uniref:Dihydroorotase n=1 Tax=Parasphingorhabdus marina DSM 22363 TaxID=1123272 RepID=A0A1N6CM65_9SPHN|nr:amidohydrolase family protein [Parasphingorhabdus marina]SIN59577.1 dihydroorotase [Parasphingorhabdus marina DSM 22363]
MTITQTLGAAIGSLLALCLSVAATAEPLHSIRYDMVIENGRAMDPETGLDAVRHIGISGGTIVAISDQPLTGARTIDATGHIVAPGFIDIHSHSPTPLGLHYQAQDGVTTTLDLEAGAYPLAAYGRLIRDKALINHGSSAGFASARVAVMTDYQQSHGVEPLVKTGDEGKPITRAFLAEASAQELTELKARITEALDAGAIGIGVPLDYVSAAVKTPELDMLFALAASHDAPLFIHIRRGLAGDPAGLDEAIAMARKHGSRTLICHMSHSAIQNTGLFLEKVRAARREGVDIWAEVLPYNAGSVFIGAAAFQRDWKAIFNIDYGDIQLAATGEWFTKESFERTQRDNPRADIIHHYLKEEWTRMLVAAPDVIISSDGLVARTTEENIPPQGVGSFAKILGKYVRDEQALDMMTALSKMSLQPAQLLEKSAPVFRLKGRLQIGMDADLTIFDPKTVRANTTYEQPHQASTGVNWLLVDGKLVIADGALRPDMFPGQFLRATPRRKLPSR